jgi:hypothetical protein
MLKVMALLRTVFLLFIIPFTIRAMPFTVDVTRTFDEQYARYATAVGGLQRACWLAITWIAFETAVGWWLATRKSRAVAPEVAPTPSASSGLHR